MDPNRFKFILQYVQKKYTVLPLLEILDTKPVTKKPLAAISFDDGYRDFIDYSIPIMDDLGIPSSIYVVTDCITNQSPTWTFALDYLFFNTRQVQIHWTLEPDFLPEQFRKNTFVNRQELIAYCQKLKQHIKKIPDEKRKLLLEDIRNSFNDVSLPGNLMMDWQQIKQLMNAGVEVGSHTVTHPPLTTVTNVELHRELQNSRLAFFNNTGICPRVISYPVGSYNQQVKDAAVKAGYDYGLAVNQRIYKSQVHDDFEIPRIELYNEPFWKTWLRIKEYV